MGTKFKLVFPTQEYKDKAIDYIDEFYKYNSGINGTGALDEYLKKADYKKWIDKVQKDCDIANIQEPNVPKLTYFYVREDDDKIIGMINIRLALNEELRKEGGHIGYSVRPTERKKGYATEMLNLGVEICHRRGIKEILVACDKFNIASSRVIKNCGGILKEEFYSDKYNETIQMYVIKAACKILQGNKE